MPRKKENLIKKIVKKNYNNELELILEKKNFDEKAKNILLSMLYKVETTYKDYEQVKKSVIPKEEFLERIINIIKNNIEELKIVEMNSEEAEELKGKTYVINKEKKQVICYPIEKVVLYAIFDISKTKKIVNERYKIISKPMSDLLNIGNNINSVEMIRDFNGFSWDVVINDIEKYEHNLIYQNIRIIVGEEFLDKWIFNDEAVLDYFDIFKNVLEEKYGNKIEKEVIDNLAQLAILLEMMYDKNYSKKLIESKEKIENKLANVYDTGEFIKVLTKEKRKLNEQIKKIDQIINDKELLQQEYSSRNAKLPLEKKIFSMKVLTKNLKQERTEIEEQMEKINQILNPQQFVKFVKEIEEKYKYLEFIEDDDPKKKMKVNLIYFQKIFLEIFMVQIDRATTKEEMMKLIIEFRYYLNIYISRNRKIKNVKQLKDEIEQTKLKLIEKAIETKTINKFSEDKEVNNLILDEIFNSKIINLQNINIKITQDNNEFILNIFDENIFDKNLQLGDIFTINVDEFVIKLNKNIKFIII